MTRYRVVTLRGVDDQGTGDARRAAQMVRALKATGSDVVVTSVMGKGGIAGALVRPRGLLALAQQLRRHGRTMPLQWVVTQAVTQSRSIPMAEPVPDEVLLYSTARTVPRHVQHDFVIDFVDSLALHAEVRARRGAARQFWRREGRLMRSWESDLATRAIVGTAVSPAEAALISPRVRAVPLSTGNRPRTVVPRVPPRDRQVVFAGNLFYRPNEEAAEWAIRHLLPALLNRGWAPDQLVIAGRRPGHRLSRLAAKANATMLRDVPDLEAIIARASVCIAPMALGAGVQNKVLDALHYARPVVITPHANRGLGLQNSALVRVCERSSEIFSAAIDDLCAVTSAASAELPPDVEELLVNSKPSEVEKRWLEVLEPVLAS